MMSRAMRVMMEKVPEPDGVDAQSKQGLLRCGNHPEVPDEEEGRGDERWHQPFDAPLNHGGFELGVLDAVDAAGGDERPDAGQCAADAGAQEEAGPVSGIEECVPEFAGLMAGSGDSKPRIARREHESKNALMR